MRGLATIRGLTLTPLGRWRLPADVHLQLVEVLDG